ncbi:ATP-grasp domain-containing protein [Microbispora triticiradicis]|uniref:ATP-grasp domain-containing protein n=1 Tax=Microbispora triticiradicis TaxID=2200763 RepID=UPI001AD741B0|nr:ATP-grasp domain-containing protein [Microbispora triticiradicis]MBO4269198.1 ATP-grasp domain-containing protein [Microbispora triticiradicis]
MANSDGVLLVMASGFPHYREYLLASIAQRGGPVWLFETERPSWQTPYIAGSTVVDVFDPEAVVAAARELAARTPVRGVISYHEAVIEAAARVAAELGLPGPAPEAVTAVRDKPTTRRLLDRAGIRQPRHALVATPEEAAAAAGRIGFPLVAKPRGLGASQGVVKVAGEAELGWAVGVSRTARQSGMPGHDEILLEQFLAGPEISVDAAVHDGEYLPYLVARKRLGGEPYFEETGHVVLADEPLLRDADLLRLLADTHRALGYTHGTTHTEVKLTPEGYALIEVNGRLGGDLIPYLGLLANGVDSGVVAADLALGVRPEVTAHGTGAVGIRFLYPPETCVARRVEMPEPDPGAGLLASVAVAGPGTPLILPPDGAIARYGFLIARGRTAEECDEVLDRAERAARFEGDPPHAAREVVSV